MFGSKKIFVDNKTLELSKLEHFAEGGNRACYIHPEHSALCIKIVKPESIGALRAKRSYIRNLHSDAYFDDNVQEYKAYQQASIKKYPERIYDHVPRCYGWQNTDIGAGLVLDYYGQQDGSPSPTLQAYLHTHGVTKEIKDKLDQLAVYLQETELLTRNILTHNVVIAQDGRLKIIDGLGASTHFNATTLSKVARRASIKRRIKRMYLRVEWEVSDKRADWLDIEKNERFIDGA